MGNIFSHPRILCASVCVLKSQNWHHSCQNDTSPPPWKYIFLSIFTNITMDCKDLHTVTHGISIVSPFFIQGPRGKPIPISSLSKSSEIIGGQFYPRGHDFGGSFEAIHPPGVNFHILVVVAEMHAWLYTVCVCHFARGELMSRHSWIWI